MTDLKKAINKINKVNSSIFYITNDAERALGIENELKNYHIICLDNNYIAQNLNGKENFFCLEKEDENSSIFRNSNRILRSPKVQEYINRCQDPQMIFFKISPLLENTCKKLGFNILNTSSDLNKLFENKIKGYEGIRDSSISLPSTIIGILKEMDFDYLYKTLGRFVLQFETGHTGDSTVFIEDVNQFEILKEKFPRRNVKVSKMINGNYFTINACIYKKKVFVGGISNQITGVEKLVSFSGATCGNDWNQIDLDNKQKDEIIQNTVLIGDIMKKKGFRGLFGVDFVSDSITGKIYVLEINARSPASIPMFTKIQAENDQLPLFLLHLMEFLEVDFNIDNIPYNKVNTNFEDYSQIIFRNTKKDTVKIENIPDGGVYSIDSLTKIKEGYSIDDLDDNSQILILPTSKEREVNGNIEYLRVQTKNSSLQKDISSSILVNDNINDRMQRVINFVLENTRLYE